MNDIAVEMRAVTKTFGPVVALDGADLIVRRGEIHGLIGQNGAGKSTIIKILAGIYARTAGDIVIGGMTLERVTPAIVEGHGVHFIHQDRLLVPTATVAEAIFLNHEPRFGPLIRYRRMNQRAATMLREYFGIELSPNALVSSLSTAQAKIVQITRALARDAKVLVLDEPTAALVSREVSSLFKVLRRLRDDGIAIIFISHYMQEIVDLCDTVTVLRNGRSVGVLRPDNSSIEQLVTLMTNQAAGDMYPARSVRPGKAILEVDKLSLAGHYSDVSFVLHAGEVVGLVGLLGSGDKQLLETLFGLRQADSGDIRLHGDKARLSSPVDAVQSGIAMVPEERRAQGVAIDLPVSENTTIASLGRYSSHGFIRTAEERQAVDRLISELSILTPSQDTPVRNLSGGNQQKVVVAKWLSCESTIYLLDEPTVAVDVRAKVEIYTLMNRLAEHGAAMLLLSSDLEEVSHVADRVLVVYRGELVAEFARGEATADELLAVASGARAPAADAAADAAA